ncbi:SAM-dependent methyltransferase [Halostreptopolyspora alba]|uniref:SAM-dependent methyltransferase n=1 Tax=Halostreptopolyspora alba TaxID=2487137 RepID=UPI0026D81B9B
MTEDSDSTPPRVATDRPTAARVYGYCLGGKDNYEVDREGAREGFRRFPEGLDIARQNRLYLYRAVRYLAAEAGITQFLDLGSGLPTDNNVHQVAQRFQSGARVVYVDIDPVVLAHGEALLVEDANTTVITADMTRPEQILDHPETHRLIDFDQPVAVLMFSVPHGIPDDEEARRAVHGPLERVPSGSYLAISHVVSEDRDMAERSNAAAKDFGMPWKTRTPDVLDAWLRDLEPVEPGLCDIADWRPDPDQPPLPPVPDDLKPFEGSSRLGKDFFEYGGVLRKP